MLIMCAHVLKEDFLNECKFSEEKSYSFKNIWVCLQSGKDSEGSISSRGWAKPPHKDVREATSNIKIEVWFQLKISTQYLPWPVTEHSAHTSPHE